MLCKFSYGPLGSITQIGDMSVQHSFLGQMIAVGDTDIHHGPLGSIIQIGNMPVRRNFWGQVTTVGNMSIRYGPLGSIIQVGDMPVEYGFWGSPTSIGDMNIHYGCLGQIVEISDGQPANPNSQRLALKELAALVLILEQIEETLQVSSQINTYS